MAGDPPRRGLGRGLAALLGEDTEVASADGPAAARSLAIDLLEPGRLQPRRHMDEPGLEELARSIADKGILQPILVRPHPDRAGRFEIVAGERRWRAAQKAGLHTVPAVVRSLADREALEIALVENLQRENLSALEEAEGYRRLVTEFAHTQDELARRIGKSRSHVTNTMRLLGLPEPVKEMLDRGALSAGHARALLAADDAVRLAHTVVKRGLNVRQTERLAQSAGAASRRRVRAVKDADTRALERDLAAHLGLAVEVRHGADGGALVLHYRTLDQLDDLLRRLRSAPRP